MKLYVSAAYPRQWIAYVPNGGWLMFPDRENGWEQRKPARGLDPIHLREVPVRLAERAGMMEPSLQEAA